MAAAPALTQFVRAAAPASALDPDEWAVSRNCPAIASLKYVAWTVPAANGLVRIAISEVQGICLTACTFNLADDDVIRALRQANLIEHGLGLASCSAIFHELHVGRIFEGVYNSDAELFTAIKESALINAAALRFSPTWLETYEPFNIAAIPAGAGAPARRGNPAVPPAPAVPAQPGPASLKFLHLTSWASVLTEGTRLVTGQESRVLARTVVLLSHRCRNATRRDMESDVQSVAGTLSTYIGAWTGLGRAATAPQLARHSASYLGSCMSIMPVDIAGPGGTATSCEAELRDGHILLRGRDSEAASVLWARIHGNLARFPVIDQFAGRLGSCGETKDMLERLMIGMQVPSGSPLNRTWELARDLERKGKWQTVRDLFAGGSSVAQVVEDLLDSHVTTAGAAAVPDSGGYSGVASASPSGFGAAGSMEQREFERAVTAPNFVEAYEAMKGVNGVALLDAAATSGSVLLLRFLFSAPAWMRPRHVAFDLLGKCLSDRAAYLAYCATVDPSVEAVPSHLETYRLTEEQVDAFWGCRWSDMDMVNASGVPHEGGFLALRYFDNGTRYSPVAKSEFYTVESSLLGVRGWFERLLLGVGFSPTPDEGFSWVEVIDRQLEFVRFFNGLPHAEKAEWQSWADDNFREHALCRAQTLFKAKLLTSRPADEVVSFFLPDGAAFFSNITAKLNDAKPLTVVRRAFPSYFPSEPVALPGTSASTHQSNLSGLPKGKGVAGGHGAPNPAGKARGHTNVDAPGSKAGLARVLDDGSLFLASRVGDIKAIAALLKVGVDDLCWPVLFSNKPGDAALALCPCPDKHGGLNSKFHRPPKGFDKDKLFKKYFSAASAEQLRTVGWRNAKKAKT